MSQVPNKVRAPIAQRLTRVPGNRAISLRTLFAIVWVIAAFFATARRDFVAFLLVGLPFALIGFAIIAGRGLGKTKFGLLMSWGAFGLFVSYWWPYLICPIELPESAHNLYVTSQGMWIAYHGEVRFDATVDDCIETANRVQRKFATHFGNPIPSPLEIDRDRGLVPSRDVMGSRRKWWLNTNSIQKGLYFPGGGSYQPEMWIDTERGIFYFRVTD